MAHIIIPLHQSNVATIYSYYIHITTAYLYDMDNRLPLGLCLYSYALSIWQFRKLVQPITQNNASSLYSRSYPCHTSTAILSAHTISNKTPPPVATILYYQLYLLLATCQQSFFLKTINQCMERSIYRITSSSLALSLELYTAFCFRYS